MEPAKDSKLVGFVTNNKWLGFLGLGVVLLGAGLLLNLVSKSPKVEVIESSQTDKISANSQSSLVVEIAGAVEKPGVYEVLASDRVERLLILAGGLSSRADRDWLEKNLNRAAKLIDGQKIYIPAKGEVQSGAFSGLVTTSPAVAGSQTSIVNLNTASISDLDRLWGIGPARAQMIIDNRPYASVEELITKKIIPKNVYERVKGQVTAP